MIIQINDYTSQDYCKVLAPQGAQICFFNFFKKERGAEKLKNKKKKIGPAGCFNKPDVNDF